MDETRIGEHLTVPEGVEVTNAISIGGDVVVSGTVLNDAVSVGGDLVVRSTGRIERYAVSVGGRIVLEPGGSIEGERIEVQNIPGIGILGQLGVLTTQLPQIQRSPPGPL